MNELKIENIAITTLEKTHLLKERRNTYVACEDLDFIWERKDIWACEVMWRDGFSIRDIARKIQRDPDEILVLLIDRARKEKIAKRLNGPDGSGEGWSEEYDDYLGDD